MSYIGNVHLERLRKRMIQSGYDVLYLRDIANIKWLTCFEHTFDSHSVHAVIITKDRAIIHTDGRYSIAIRAAIDATGMDIELSDEPLFHWEYLKLVLEKQGLDKPQTKIAIEDSISLSEFRALQRVFDCKLDFVETKSFVMQLRQIKDATEIEIMRHAQKITDDAFAHIVDFVKPGVTELELRDELESYCFAHGAEGMAFETIIATGANAANSHAIPCERVIEIGQCVLFDFGAAYKQYCSDMTRMVFVGKPDVNSLMYRGYEAVRAANEETSALMKAGVSGVDMHNNAMRVLADRGFEGKMVHSLGHAVGMEIHEEPSLNGRTDFTLQEGNIVTCEPGVYFEGDFGIRIEDCGLITVDGYDKFTATTRDMIVV